MSRIVQIANGAVKDEDVVHRIVSDVDGVVVGGGLGRRREPGPFVLFWMVLPGRRSAAGVELPRDDGLRDGVVFDGLAEL